MPLQILMTFKLFSVYVKPKNRTIPGNKQCVTMVFTQRIESWISDLL